MPSPAPTDHDPPGSAPQRHGADRKHTSLKWLLVSSLAIAMLPVAIIAVLQGSISLMAQADRERAILVQRAHDLGRYERREIRHVLDALEALATGEADWLADPTACQGVIDWIDLRLRAISIAQIVRDELEHVCGVDGLVSILLDSPAFAEMLRTGASVTVERRYLDLGPLNGGRQGHFIFAVPRREATGATSVLLAAMSLARFEALAEDVARDFGRVAELVEIGGRRNLRVN